MDTYQTVRLKLDDGRAFVFIGMAQLSQDETVRVAEVSFTEPATLPGVASWEVLP
jgi:hypothetical protein